MDSRGKGARLQVLHRAPPPSLALWFVLLFFPVSMGSRNGHPPLEDGIGSAEGRDSRRAPSLSRSASRESCPICQAASAKDSSTCCSRCDRRCCAECVTLKRYGASTDVSSSTVRTAVCKACDERLCVVGALPRSTWMLIQEYCEDDTRQHLLQLCHATQLGVLLPYRYGRFGWGSFFAERTFLSRGANGAVFKTHLRDDIPDDIWVPNCGADRTRDDWSNRRECDDAPGSFRGNGGRYEKTVAVKTIPKSSVFSIRKWSHILREVDALRRCQQHPHVVRLLFVAQGPSEVYIALQYVEGGDLFDWLVRQQVPSEEDVATVAQQLLSTLHYLHEECGVVHRDIKPENILLDTEAARDNVHHGSSEGKDDEADNLGQLYIRLADFGYAKVLPLVDTVTGGVWGEESPTSTDNGASHTFGRAPLLPPLLPQRPHTNGSSTGASPRGLTGRIAFDMPSRQRSRSTRAMISATPCGTLGFAAPEILTAYNAQKEAAAASTPACQRGGGARPGDGGSLLSPGPLTPISLIKRMDVFAAGVTIAILLTGSEPFPCVSSEGHLEAVRSGVDFAGPQWRYVSKSAKRLLRSMLAPRAADRPSALECLNSLWLEQYSQPSENGEWGLQGNAGIGSNGDGSGDVTAIREQMGRSFQNSVRSLRKNDGWLFVQNEAGVVATVPRRLVEAKGGGNCLPVAAPTTEAAGEELAEP